MNLTGEERINKWLREKKWKIANFQKETLDAFLQGKSGILNAPTGSGKTLVSDSVLNRIFEIRERFYKRLHL